jgi:hypothetical protein
VRLSKNLVAAGLWAAAMAVPLQADYLTNTDFSDGISGWHGDGEAAYLKADGTEGAEGDVGVITVIKLPLAERSSHSVYQEFDTRDHPKTLQFKVDVYASSDFKRSASPDDYTSEVSNFQAGTTLIWSEIAVLNVDFWMRLDPGSYYKMDNLKPKTWVTLKVKWDSIEDDESRKIYFCVPPGDGFVYIKNPSVTQ